MGLFASSTAHVSYFRHYRQDEDGLRIVSSRTVDLGDDPLLAGSWDLPLWVVEESRGGVQGRRCLVVLPFNCELEEYGTVDVVFGGMVDVWELGEDCVAVRELMVGTWGPEN
ncbi:hypothetical protein BJX64DRAFT_21520 [Aspergillus heterothallicus]